MKRTVLLLSCICLLLVSGVCANAQNYVRGRASVFDKNGTKQYDTEFSVMNFAALDGTDAELYWKPQTEAPADALYDVCEDYEYLLTYDFKTTDAENPYPEIEKMTVKFEKPLMGGGDRASRLGENYRLYYIQEDTAEELPFTETDRGISFQTDKLGRYALYFDDALYDVTFYLEEPVYEDGSLVEQEPYCVLTGLKAKDTVVFPEIPTKEGYVFTGWKARSGDGIYFAAPQPHTAFNPARYYASWCAEADYSPLKIELSAENSITAGQEQGQQLKLTVSDGFFTENIETLAELENWDIIGSSDVAIDTVERVDDKTVQLTLSGNSKDIYTDAALSVAFESSLLHFIKYDDEGQEYSEPEKVQLDSDGVKAAWYKTDNAVVCNRQQRPGGHGSLGPVQYTVTFDTDGGTEIEPKRVENNHAAAQPGIPEKEGFIFAGWYTDKELTIVYDFSKKVTSNITLYAKWEEPEDTAQQIVLTIGKKEVTVSGETRLNDVAPVIRNERTMIPARFVAESLGAVVTWDGKAQEVTVRGRDEQDMDVTIRIKIGSDTAYVNEEAVLLDAPAFVENDRTYTPLRFISERLGASVLWDGADQIITITK